MSEPAVLEKNPDHRQEQEPPRSPPAAHFPALKPGQGAPLICLAGLIGCFFAPWTTFGQNESAATLYQNQHFGLCLWAIPAFAVFTLASFNGEKSVQRKFGTITAVLAWLGVGYLILKLGPFAVFGLRWGASFTVLFALALFAVSGEQRVTLPVDLVAKKLSSRKADVYSHSLTVPTGIHFAAKDFYAKLEAAIQARQWPGVQVLRIDYTEAGLLSHKREYLRIIRQRHLFDLCASTFGQDYFFSIREAEIPAVVTGRVFFAFLFAIFIAITLALQTLGLLFGPLAILFLGIFAVWFLFNVLKMGLTQVDSTLLRTPIIGPVYEAWIRRETYFQQDTRMVFLHSVNELTKQMVEETVSAKGIKFLDFFEKHPILGDLYQRSRTPVNPPKPPEK